MKDLLRMSLMSWPLACTHTSKCCRSDSDQRSPKSSFSPLRLKALSPWNPPSSNSLLLPSKVYHVHPIYLTRHMGHMYRAYAGPGKVHPTLNKGWCEIDRKISMIAKVRYSIKKSPHLIGHNQLLIAAIRS